MQRSALRVQKEEHEAEQQKQIDDEHWFLDVPELAAKEWVAVKSNIIMQFQFLIIKLHWENWWLSPVMESVKSVISGHLVLVIKYKT